MRLERPQCYFKIIPIGSWPGRLFSGKNITYLDIFFLTNASSSGNSSVLFIVHNKGLRLESERHCMNNLPFITGFTRNPQQSSLFQMTGLALKFPVLVLGVGIEDQCLSLYKGSVIFYQWRSWRLNVLNPGIMDSVTLTPSVKCNWGGSRGLGSISMNITDLSN